MIPRPFTRLVFAYGDPIEVPREASDEELESCRARIERGIEEATRKAEQALREESIWKA
jgi:lysophospholipid acyltransferase (LPLAT)-like uncharacterized protein